MMKRESQNVEFKESWRDEYLKWICGFANAQGGELYIGIRDDGSVCGVSNAKRLMEEIPNKAVQLLGVVVDVDLLKREGLDVVRVRVNAYSVPISFRGVYHYRSGATKQELSGVALQDFLFRKTGLSWDDAVCEGATLKEIDERAIRYFLRHAIESGRMPEDAKDMLPRELLEGLGLVTDGGMIKNAAILLFGRYPERRFPSAHFKIGRFGVDETDLMFQDMIEGNILQMADRVVDVLRSKYLISPISYRGLVRVENLEVPEPALREAIFNAIVHRNYAGAHTQMKVWNDRIELWNDGSLPIGFSLEQLQEPHGSHPRNRNIANVFYRAGFIEAWGRGIAKITKGFVDAGLEMPTFNEFCGGLQVVLKRKEVKRAEIATAKAEIATGKAEIALQTTLQTTPETTLETTFETTLETLSAMERAIVKCVQEKPSISRNEMADKLGITLEGVRYHIKALKNKIGLHHEGPTKKGQWVIGA